MPGRRQSLRLRPILGLAILLALGMSCHHASSTKLTLGGLPERRAPEQALDTSFLTGARSFDLPDARELERPAKLERIKAVLADRARHLSQSARQDLAEELERSERQLGIDAFLLLALIEQESSFRPRARGPRGSLGLMQVRPFVARAVAERRGLVWTGPQMLHDPATNVRIGARYLAEMRKMYPEDRLALAAYNMGPYRVKRILARGSFPATRYPARVLERYERLISSF